MAGERVKLVVQNRSILGSAEARRLRRQGLIPGVLYGREAPVAISIPERDLRHALTGAAGTNAVLDVVVDSGNTHSSVLKEYQLEPVRGTITHVDLQEVRLDRPIHATVPLHLAGEAPGVREGGVLSQVVTEVNVEALPMEVPDRLELTWSPEHPAPNQRVTLRVELADSAFAKVNDAGAAEEVAQNVFAALARKAWSFAPDDSVPAWLYRSTLLEAREWLRGELRRRRREQTAAELGTTMKTPEEDAALRAGPGGSPARAGPLVDSASRESGAGTAATSC